MLSLSGVLVDEPVGCLELEVQHSSLRAGSGNPLSKQVAKQDSSVDLMDRFLQAIAVDQLPPVGGGGQHAFFSQAVDTPWVKVVLLRPCLISGSVVETVRSLAVP